MIHDHKRLISGAPYVRRTWRYVELQFRDEVTQTRMLRWCPHWLLVGYTRTMLAALLLQPRPAMVGILGLGGGAQAKFCYQYLPHSRIEAVESDAQVLALRDRFAIPADDARFSVELADGDAWLQQRRSRYQLLLVDAYDAHGIPPALTTLAFYQRCAAALVPGGVMATNLYATDVRTHLKRLRRAFAGNVCVIDEPGMDNKVAFAWHGRHDAVDADAVLHALPWLARRQLAPSIHRLAQRLRAHTDNSV
jgi:spermidine synthase